MSVLKDVSELVHSVEEHFSASGDPDYLIESRTAAMTEYERLPQNKYERSDVSRRNMRAFTTAAPSAGRDWDEIAAHYIAPTDEHPLLVFADGELVFTRGLAALQSLGLIYMSLREAARVYPELVQKHLGTVVLSNGDQLLSLQAALWRDGAFIYVPRNVVCMVPLQMVHVTTTGGSGTFPRNLIVAEAMSQVTFLDTYVAHANLSDDLHVGVTEVAVESGAKVKIGTIQDLPKKSTNITARKAKVARDGGMDWVIGEMGDGFTVAEFGSVLVGDGSRSTGHAIALGSGRAHFDLTSRMVHVGKFSESDTSARGVMQDKANAVYRGVTQILKGASGANGQQSEKLLMLSPQSRADAIPMLLIDENDVKCGHAASVGQINEEQLFYLMSRGISELAAKRMLVWGFLDPVLAELPVDIVRTAVETVLGRKMG